MLEPNQLLRALSLAFGLMLFCSAGCRRLPENQLPQTALARIETSPAETIVSPQWVKAALDFHSGNGSPRPTGYRNDRLVILETSWAEPAAAKDYLAGHIPSAIHFNTDLVENGYPRWLLRPINELHQVIGEFGITPETTVVVYSKQTIAAARIWWVLMYAGVSDVRFLDGGFEAWTAAGFPSETNVRTPQAVKFSATVREELLATTDYVRARLNESRVFLADARSPEEFAGKVSGYEYIDFKGRIPGSVNIGNADDSTLLYKQANGRLKSFAEVRAIWEQAGWKQAGAKDDEREVIVYCGSGWRSSLVFLYAWTMGFKKIRNYSDGWAGWSTNYIQDEKAKGGTPGWRQERTKNPIFQAEK